jgi:hypothetical protein
MRVKELTSFLIAAASLSSSVLSSLHFFRPPRRQTSFGEEYRMVCNCDGLRSLEYGRYISLIIYGSRSPGSTPLHQVLSIAAPATERRAC